MEIYQLRYFQEVIRQGGVNRAAEHLRISAPAISKAITNLEAELSAALFNRIGGRLLLTEKGKHLLKRANEILILEQKAKSEISEVDGIGEVTIAGCELFLEEFGINIVLRLMKKHPGVIIHFLEASGTDAIEAVDSGRAHLALTIQKPAASWQQVRLAEVKSVTVAGPGHPLLKNRARSKAIPIKEILEHPFISPNLPLFGRTGESKSIDGWRDDVHPRKIAYIVETICVFRELLMRGRGLAYIPDFWAKKIGAEILKVEGCSFVNKNHLYCSAKLAKDYSWLGSLITDLADDSSNA